MATFDQIMQLDGLCSRVCMERLVEWARMAPAEGHVIDLGTYRGRSAAMLCHAVGDHRVITIDHWQMPTEGGSSAALARRNLARVGYAPRVVTALSHLIPEGVASVAALFIDSYHNDRTLRREVEAWLPRLSPEGIVMLHDYDPRRYPSLVKVIDEVFHGPGWDALGLVEDLAGFRRSAL